MRTIKQIGIAISAFLITVSVLFGLLMYDYIRNVQLSISDDDYNLILNNCDVYEKLGNNTDIQEHEYDSGIYSKNGQYKNFIIEGYKHIHCLVKNDVGEFFCAAISDNDIKFLIKLDSNRQVLSKIEVKYLPSKIFVYQKKFIAYYIGDGSALLYEVDFDKSDLKVIFDDVSISDSNTAKLIDGYYKGFNEYFDLYDYEYDEYIRNGKDLLYTLFDYGCFEDVYVYGDAVVYMTAEQNEKSQWKAKSDNYEKCFLNGDRCFGFVGDTSLLFYKKLHLVFFDLGLFYFYDYINETKSNFKIILNKEILYGSIDDAREKLYFNSSNKDYMSYYCMDIDSGIYAEIDIGFEYFGQMQVT